VSGALGFARRHPDALAVIAIVGLALLFKLGFALRVAPFIAKDSQAYFLPAWDLVHGGAFQLGLRRTPAYPLFLAGALLLAGDDLRGIVLLQHLLGVGTAVLAYWLGRLAFGRGVGLGAGALVAISAPLVTYEHYLLTETLFTFMVTASLVALLAAWRRGSARLWLVGGLLVGLSTLVKPIGQVFLPLALLAPIVAASPWRHTTWAGASAARSAPTPPVPTPPAPRPPPPGPRSLALRSLATAPLLVLVGYGLAVAPWTIRNQLVYDLASPSTFGRTLIARTASYDRGFQFYDPASPPADPAQARALQIIQRGADRNESDGTIATRLRQELDLDPIEVNALMRDAALGAIARQPLYFVQGSLLFGLRIFNGTEIRLRDHESERKDVVWEDRTRGLLTAARSEDDARVASGLLRWYQPAEYAPLPLMLFAVGLLAALARPAWRPALLPGFTVAALVLASAALNGPQERYRYPVDPALTVVALGGVAGLIALAGAVARRVGGRARMPRTAPTPATLGRAAGPS